MDKISTVIVTYNSEKVLEKCLQSVIDISDEIIVVDLHSVDTSVNIAKKYSARVVAHAPVLYVEKVRDFSIRKATNDWVLVLDPDERIGPELKNKLKDVDARLVDAVNIPTKNIFFGKWIRHTNFWPDHHIRFFNKSKIKWPSVLHAYPQIAGKIMNLDADPSLAIQHDSYTSWEEFFDRNNRYSTIAAEHLQAQGEKFSILKFGWLPFREILVRLVKHMGFLDGTEGIGLVIGLVIYQLSVQIKLWTLGKSVKHV